MKVVVVTDPDPALANPSCLARMLAAGAYRIHIRKPAWSSETMTAFVASFSEADRSGLSVHSHYAAALAVGVGGIHFTHRTSDDERQRLMKQAAENGAVCSASVHSCAAVREQGELAYLFLSPIFDSISKAARAAFDAQELRNTLRRTAVPVFALGGITPDRIGIARSLGFAGVASLGFVWQDQEPDLNFLRLQKSASAYDNSIRTIHSGL